VVSVVDFISDMWQAGYEYSTINGFRSAISAWHKGEQGLPIGQHVMVKRAMTGVHNERPPRPRYTHTWDVDVVLRHIERLGPNTALEDKTLTHKLAMLLALTTASRASEINSLNLEYMVDRGDVITFTIPTLTKTRKVGVKPVLVTLTAHDNVVLDVVNCTRDYIRRTAQWRVTKDRHQLLLGVVAPHKPVVTSTISNWLKYLMKAAGVDVETFKGHSTRGAATSKARATGLSVAEIMANANWSNAGTFHRYYDREVVTVGAFAHAVLQ